MLDSDNCALNKVKPYLDGTDVFIIKAIRSEFRAIAKIHQKLEEPFRIKVNLEEREDLAEYNPQKITITGEKISYLPQPDSPDVAFTYFMKVSAKVAFQVIKKAFRLKYGKWKAVFLEEAVNDIEEFIKSSRDSSVSSAFAIKYKRAADEYQYDKPVDTSFYAEYLRLSHGFYTNYYVDKGAFSTPALVYATCEYFLPYLKSKLAIKCLKKEEPEGSNELAKDKEKKGVPKAVYFLPCSKLNKIFNEFNGELWENMELKQFYSLFNVNNDTYVETFKVKEKLDFYALLRKMHEASEAGLTQEEFIKPLLERHGCTYGSYQNIKKTRFDKKGPVFTALLKRIDNALL